MLEWLGMHSADLWSLFSSIVAVASIVTKLTPSAKDDAWLAKAVQFVALNKTK